MPDSSEGWPTLCRVQNSIHSRFKACRLQLSGTIEVPGVSGKGIISLEELTVWALFLLPRFEPRQSDQAFCLIDRLPRLFLQNLDDHLSFGAAAEKCPYIGYASLEPPLHIP